MYWTHHFDSSNNHKLKSTFPTLEIYTGIACARFGESKQILMHDSSKKDKQHVLEVAIDLKEEKNKTLPAEFFRLKVPSWF